MTEQNFRRLPPEIMEEILCNLPVKSLNRFRCVSSDWQSLISDNHFIRKHLTASQRMRYIVNDIKSIVTGHHLWFPLSSSNFTENEFVSDVLSIAPLLNMSEQEFRLPWVHASCDGLLCVDYCCQMYISNPCMKTFRLIDDCSIYGYFVLGYDSISDDYKLIKINANTAETWVYSLRNRSWTRAEDFPFPETDIHCYAYTFMKGRIYWLAYCYNNTEHAFFNLDLSENKYKNISVNVPIWECFPRALKLTVLRGMLSVCFHNKEADCLDLWVMKDCTDQNSWTRILTVPFQLLFRKYGDTPMDFEALYLYENGEVLVGVVSRYGIVTRNGNVGTEALICKDSRILSRKMINHRTLYIRMGLSHVESLISP